MTTTKCGPYPGPPNATSRRRKGATPKSQGLNRVTAPSSGFDLRPPLSPTSRKVLNGVTWTGEPPPPARSRARRSLFTGAGEMCDPEV